VRKRNVEDIRALTVFDVQKAEDGPQLLLEHYSGNELPLWVQPYYSEDSKYLHTID
jgi:hypothetical protein